MAWVVVVVAVVVELVVGCYLLVGELVGEIF